MAAFRFRLQAALDRAVHLEDQASLALSELLADQERQQRELETQLAQAERASRHLSAQQLGVLDLPAVHSRRLHLEQTWARVAEQRLQLEDTKARLVAQQELLLRLRQEREKLERLREEQFTAHLQEALAQEGRELEELSRLVFSRGGEG